MKKFVIGNWKCNPQGLVQAKELLNSIRKGTADVKNAKVVICPPFVYLSHLIKTRANFKFGAQDCFWHEGAFTGEVSVAMLKSLGCEYVIIGHSERRKYFGETNETANKKLKAAFEAGLTPIFCIGETVEQREGGKTDDILLSQLERGLAGLSLEKPPLIAYEPIWAIGTGNACDAQDAQKVRLLIRQEIGENVPILYGGSVNSENVKSYIDVGYQGVLVGGASLKPEEFTQLLTKIE